MGVPVMEQENQEFKVKLPTFEGPLDLLWNLIKKSKLDITEISLSQITAEYIDYINLLKSLDIDIASDFVLMASTLLHYKSQILLPVDNDLEDDYDPPLPQELVDQLMEYKKYQEAAHKLDELSENQGEYYPRGGTQFVFDFEEGREGWEEIGLLGLINAFAQVAESFDLQLVKEVEVDEVSVEQGMEQVRSKLKSNNNFLFSELFGDKPSKVELVSIFLALLEMVRIREIAIKQHQLFGEIRIFQRELEDENESRTLH